MMAVGLAVGGNVHQLRPVALVREAALKARGKILAAIQQMLKSHGLRNRPVIKKEVDLCSRRQFGEIGACGIDAAAVNVFPASPADLAHPSGLIRRQHREFDSVLGQGLKGLNIYCRLRQPHAFRQASKAVLKIMDAPLHLRMFVAGISQGQDHVVISLGHG